MSWKNTSDHLICVTLSQSSILDKFLMDSTYSILNTNTYINRIKFTEDLKVDAECLSALHKCHVMTIPFEVLDVQVGNPINLDLTQIFQKVIDGNRGGYCYELNYLFHWLLSEIGFDCHLVSARIFDNGKYGPEYDHMALIVNLDEPWLVDVGYGDMFVKPLKLLPNIIQEEQFKFYKLERHSKNKYVLLESLKEEIRWIKRYSFNTRECLIDDFGEQNEYKQSSKESYFVRNLICTMPTPLGRKTILNNTFKLRVNNEVHITEILNEEDLRRILEREFNIAITETISSKRL